MIRLRILFAVLFLCSCQNVDKPSTEMPESRISGTEDSLLERQEFRSSDGKQYFLFPPHYPSKWTVTSDSMLHFFEDTLHIKQAYNTAKWLTYCYACFDTISYTEAAIKRFDLPKYSLVSQLELALGDVSELWRHPHKGDAFEYVLSLAIKDSIAHSSQTILMPPYSNYFDEYIFYDLFFDKDSQTSIIGFGNTIGSSYTYNLTWFSEKKTKKFAYERTCPVAHAIEVFKNPFQPEVIKHVRENANTIHPWFLAEAKKRGMFDSVKYSPQWVEAQIAINKRKPKDCLQPGFDMQPNNR